MTTLNLYLPTGTMGYGIAARGLLRGLVNAFPADRFGLWAIGQDQPPPEDISIIRTCMENARTPNFSAPCVKVWHQNDMGLRVGNGKFWGFPIFELDTFTEQEVAHLSTCDGLLATSTWGVDTLKKVFPEKIIKAVPLGVDSQLFSPSGPVHTSFERRPETFVIMNVGKWEIRKGANAIPTVLKEAFPGNEDYLLVMANHNVFLTEKEHSDWHSWYRDQLGEKVVFLDRFSHQNHLAMAMRSADVGFFPFRAEGWNLELMEFMALGKPVVATNYSAPTAYFTSENALTVTPQNLERAFDSKWFFGQGNWAEIGQKEITSFASHLRSLYEKKRGGEALVNQAGILTAKQFSWENAARTLMSAIFD